MSIISARKFTFAELASPLADYWVREGSYWRPDMVNPKIMRLKKSERKLARRAAFLGRHGLPMDGRVIRIERGSDLVGRSELTRFTRYLDLAEKCQWSGIIAMDGWPHWKALFLLGERVSRP